MANQTVVESSAASNTNAIHLRASGTLGKLNQGGLQAELFESLLKLPAFSTPISPPPVKPDERREEGILSPSKDSTAKNNADQEAGASEEDQEIKLNDGPLALIQQPAIAICYCRAPDRPVSDAKPIPTLALGEEITTPPTTEGSSIDLSLQESLSANAIALKPVAKPAMVEGDATATPITPALVPPQGARQIRGIESQGSLWGPRENANASIGTGSSDT